MISKYDHLNLKFKEDNDVDKKIYKICLLISFKKFLTTLVSGIMFEPKGLTKPGKKNITRLERYGVIRYKKPTLTITFGET